MGGSLGLAASKDRPRRLIGDLEAGGTDPVSQGVGSGELPCSPGQLSLIGEGLDVVRDAHRCASTRSRKERTAASASSEDSEWKTCPAPSRSTSAAPGM